MTTTTIDPNQIAATVLLDGFERSLTSVGRAADSAYDSLSIVLKSGYRKYKKNSAAKYAHVRTIIHRDRPIPLEDIYVTTSFTHDRKAISDLELIELVSQPCRVLVQGTAGGGKTVFLRLLNLAACRSTGKVLPIFIELKSLNYDPTKSIIDLAREYLQDNGLDYSDKSVQKLVENGNVLFILDGFDEINHELRERYAEEISEICRNFPNSGVVISSRPDDMISSVERLSVYRVNPFGKEQAIELLSKLPYDSLVKSKFISKIDDEFFKKHRDFLSIPLLVTMMLMTYHQFAEIPSKAYLIYENAFATLFSWHDSSKDVFKRKSHTNLAMDDFKRLFAYFCFDSYIDQRFQFAEWDLLERIEKSKNAEGIVCQKEDIIKDLLVSTCLMQRDGVSITFVHRSFQEYFAAFYISRLDDRNAKVALDAASKRAGSDLVLPMVEGMAAPLFERAWALPTLKALNKRISKIVPSEDPFDFFRVFFQSFTMEGDSMSLVYGGSIWSSRLLSLSRVYPKGARLPAKQTRKGIDAFFSAVSSNKAYRRSVESEIGFRLTDQMLERRNFSVSLARCAVAMSKYLTISEWAASEQKYLRNLEVEVAQRVKDRKDSFRVAVSRQ